MSAVFFFKSLLFIEEERFLITGSSVIFQIFSFVVFYILKVQKICLFANS